MTIDLTDLHYAYARRPSPAVQGVSAVFRQGEITLLAGGSGSGKTTLIRCINGLIPHTYKEGTLSGQIRCFGKSTGGLALSQIARKIGTVMQDPEKQIVATRVENELAFGLENQALPREEIRARLRAAARNMGIEDLLGRDTYSLSGGERQKVVIAAVLAMQPRALLLDEPLASLDPPSAREALAQFRRLATEGITVVIVEHRVQEVLGIQPEHCVVLRNGAVVFDGDTAAYQHWRGGDPPSEPVTMRRPKTARSPSLLAFDRVSFDYASATRAQARNASVDIRAGEVVALLGPNGAGKSTLCKLAIGLLKPTQGHVRVMDRDTSTLTTAQIAKEVGYVFQLPSTTLFANTLREELSFGPRNLGMAPAQIDATIRHAMDLVELEQLPLEASPFGLSYGQQKRVAIAGVLAMQPRMLILDEPTAGLDHGTADQVMTNLLSADGAPEALLIVTHDLRLARRYATRAIVLTDGDVVADGAVHAVLDDSAVMQRGGLL